MTSCSICSSICRRIQKLRACETSISKSDSGKLCLGLVPGMTRKPAEESREEESKGVAWLPPSSLPPSSVSAPPSCAPPLSPSPSASPLPAPRHYSNNQLHSAGYTHSKRFSHAKAHIYSISLYVCIFICVSTIYISVNAQSFTHTSYKKTCIRIYNMQESRHTLSLSLSFSLSLFLSFSLSLMCMSLQRTRINIKWVESKGHGVHLSRPPSIPSA